MSTSSSADHTAHPRWNPPPWETAPTLTRRQQRRRRWPVLGRLFVEHDADRDAAYSVKNAYHDTIRALNQIDDLHASAGNPDFGRDQALTEQHRLAAVIDQNLAADPRMREQAYADGYGDRLDHRHDRPVAAQLDTHAAVQDLADAFLAARRAGDEETMQQLRGRLTPDRIDRLIGSYRGEHSADPAVGTGPWTWTERVNHLGDSGVFVDLAAQRTRDYVKQARADRDAGRPSAIDPDHPEHDHYLLRNRHYRELQDAQDCRDAERAARFVDEIRYWAATQALDVQAEPGIIDGSINLTAATHADRDAADRTMAELRQRWAPDHVTLAAALGDTRFTELTTQLRREQQLNDLLQAQSVGDRDRMRAIRDTMTPPDTDHTIDRISTELGNQLHRDIESYIQHQPTDDNQAQLSAPAAGDHVASIDVVDDQRSHRASAITRNEPAAEDQHTDRDGPADTTTADRPGTTIEPNRDEPGPSAAPASQGPAFTSQIIDRSDESPITARNPDLFIDDHRSQVNKDLPLDLDRDQPQAPRGQADPEPAQSSTDPAPQERLAATDRSIDNHDASNDVSPDVQQLQAAVDNHVAHHRAIPAADESPPQPSTIGREL